MHRIIVLLKIKLTNSGRTKKLLCFNLRKSSFPTVGSALSALYDYIDSGNKCTGLGKLRADDLLVKGVTD